MSAQPHVIDQAGAPGAPPEDLSPGIGPGEVGAGSPALDPPSLGGRRASLAKRAVVAVAWALVGFGVVLAAWQFATTRVPQLPTPSATWTEIKLLLQDPFTDNGPNGQGIGLQLMGSLGRVFTGFGLAALIGVPLGLAMGSSKRVWQAANPVVQLLRPVSPLAWFPIWLVAFQDAPRAAVWVIFMTALWPTVIGTAAGVAEVPGDHRNVAKVFRFSKLAYLRHVLIPDTLGSIVTGLRQSMSTAWMVIVAVEMLAGGVGIGDYVWEQYNAMAFTRVVAAIVFIGITGLVIDALFLRLARAVSIEEPHA